MVLGYYKYRLKYFISQSLLKFRLRRKNYIGKSCSISKDVIIGNNCQIRDDVIIGKKVELSDSIIVGRNSSLNNINIGKKSHIEGGVICTGNGNGKITVGENTYIGVYNILDWSDNIFIGNFVHIAGPSTGLWTHTSALMCQNSKPLSESSTIFRPTSPIVIEDNVYIGGNCTIYPGVTIGHHSIVAPNSAVNKDVKPYTLVSGVPAKIIKKL